VGCSEGGAAESLKYVADVLDLMVSDGKDSMDARGQGGEQHGIMPCECHVSAM